MNSTVENLRRFPSLPGLPCSDPSFRHRFYRISSGSCTDSHSDLCFDGCGGNPSGCTSFQSKPYRILHLHAAGFSVLCLGTIYGVIIGILLSFVAVILKATNPPRSFRGMIPGRDAYFDLSKNRFAYPIKGVVIYRFSENLFFANIKIFQEDIENSIQKDTRVVIVDASAINSIDVTAADRLDAISANLKKRGIRFYLTEHSTQINDQLRQFGIGHMIKDGMVRRTILAALHDAGIEAPYELDVPKEDETKLLRRSIAFLPAEEENTLEEFAWAFGDDAVKEIEESVHHIIEQLHQIPDIQRLSEEGLEELLDNWHGLGVLDEDELLRRIELHMDELPEELTSDRKLILQLLEKRRGKLKEKILAEHPEVLERWNSAGKSWKNGWKSRIQKLFRNGNTGRKSISKTDFCIPSLSRSMIKSQDFLHISHRY